MLDNLNPQQKEAVLHNGGPLLIFAGAGSGKTRVITYRIARLISEGIVEPENILAVTFTRKAAGEMKERVLSLLRTQGKGPKVKSKSGFSRLPFIGTFHSFGALILRKEGRNLGIPVGFSIYDTDDSVHLIKTIMDELNIDKKQFNPNNIKSYISSAKNEMISPKDYPKYAQDPFGEIVAEIYPKYEDKLREQGAVDFDDLQILPLKLFSENKQILKKYNDQYKYILVDEYQDTNTVQYRLVKLLSGKNKNICVVGDDDQGIYSWRGATIKNILSFERDFPGAKIVKLEKNYRSTKNILHAAQSVILHNNERAEKELWTESETGDEILMYEAATERKEAKYVIDKIKELKKEGFEYSEMAILYRTNAQSRAFEEELIRNAVPYKLVGGVRFYERKEIKDIMACLRFLANPQDDLSFFRVINVPPRKIGDKSVSDIKEFTAEVSDGKVGAGLLMLIIWGSLSGVKKWKEYLPGIEVPDSLISKLESPEVKEFSESYAKIISLFGKLYEVSMKENVRILIDEILDATKYESWIDDGTPQAQSRKENIFELKVVAERYVSQGPRDSLLALLADVALVEQDFEYEEGTEYDALTLMTLHTAKGLEFDVVFMVGMEEGLFPHSLSFTSPSELEEERRLCYVGITRARKRLFLTFADSRKTYGGLSERIPSRFISEIPMDIVHFVS